MGVNMKTGFVKFGAALVIVAAMTVSALAHSGGTDSKGGHYNRSTGEYHYHHGNPAHQHINGECPYDSTNKKSETTIKGSATTPSTQKQQPKQESKVPENEEDKDSGSGVSPLLLNAGAAGAIWFAARKLK